jgi:hypothetical protein
MAILLGLLNVVSPAVVFVKGKSRRGPSLEWTARAGDAVYVVEAAELTGGPSRLKDRTRPVP